MVTCTSLPMPCNVSFDCKAGLGLVKSSCYCCACAVDTTASSSHPALLRWQHTGLCSNTLPAEHSKLSITHCELSKHIGRGYAGLFPPTHKNLFSLAYLASSAFLDPSRTVNRGSDGVVGDAARAAAICPCQAEQSSCIHTIITSHLQSCARG